MPTAIKRKFRNTALTALVCSVTHAICTSMRFKSKLHSYEYTARLISQSGYLPLLFDLSKDERIKTINELSNTALVPVSCVHSGLVKGCDDLYFAFVRSQRASHKRWGRDNIVGIMNISHLTIPLQSASDYLSDSEEMVKRCQRDSHCVYHELLRRVNETNEMYGAISSQSVWPYQFSLLQDHKDVRIFYNSGRTCTLSIKRDSSVYIACFNSFYNSFSNSNMPPQSFIPNFTSKVTWGVRNVVPLVNVQHESYGSSKDSIWLFDAQGSSLDTPIIRSYSLKMDDRYAKDERNPGNGTYRMLQGCDRLKNWRGNTPVMQLSPKIWITIVHKRINLPTRSAQNALGREYANMILLLKSKHSHGPPSHCVSDVVLDNMLLPTPGSQDLMSNTFVFLLGLVHVGVTESNRKGTYHQFIASGAIDDFMPVLLGFQVFIPAGLSE